MPALLGRDTKGRLGAVTWGAGAPETLLLAFSATCPECRSSWPMWLRIDRLHGAPLRIVCLNIGGGVMPSGGFAAPCPLPNALNLDTVPISVALAYSIRFVPQTILISSLGKVEWSRVGVFSARDLAELRLRMSASAVRRTTPSD